MSIENVYFKYDSQKWLLENINLEINHGDRIGIIGDNGSGKSTLAKILTGIHCPKEGQVSLMGKPVSWILHYPEVAYIGDPGYEQDLLGLPYNLTVESLINIFLSFSTEINDKAVDIYNGLNIENFKKTAVEHLSKGQRQKVMAMLALVKQPKLLIVDEPTEGMDSHCRSFFLHYIEQLIHKTNLSIIWISHRLDEIYKFSQTVYTLEEGKLKPDHAQYFDIISQMDSGEKKHLKNLSPSAIFSVLGRTLADRSFQEHTFVIHRRA